MAKVSYALPLAASQADEIREIARAMRWTADSIPEKLAATTSSNSRVIAYADTILDEMSKQHGLQWDVEESVLSFAASAPTQLDSREMKIWKVIQRGVKGPQYCRELDYARVAPQRRGVWKDCPRNYLSAYREGKPWRHRIQDEKAKIRRKAELAGLASE